MKLNEAVHRNGNLLFTINEKEAEHSYINHIVYTIQVKNLSSKPQIIFILIISISLDLSKLECLDVTCLADLL